MDRRLDQEPVTYQVLEVPIERIRAFDGQPRKWFDPAELGARAESMRTAGQQTPVTVERVAGDPDHDYELIDGESRLRSARLAGLKTLLCAVRSRPFASRTDKHLASLVANFNRSDHAPMEVSDALRVQLTDGRRSQAELARAIGKSEFWVSDYLSLQRLHPDVKALLHPSVPRTRRLTPAAAFVLARVPEAEQPRVLERARGTDGRVTVLRVRMAVEASGVVVVKRRRTLNPAKRRERIAGTLRALAVDVERLRELAAAHGEEVRALAAGNELSARALSLVDEDLWTLERFERARRHREARPEHVAQLRAGINEFRRLLEDRWQERRGLRR